MGRVSPLCQIERGRGTVLGGWGDAGRRAGRDGGAGIRGLVWELIKGDEARGGWKLGKIAMVFWGFEREI